MQPFFFTFFYVLGWKKAEKNPKKTKKKRIMKCYFNVQNGNGSEISSIIHYNSSYDLLMTIYDFLNNMKRSGWKFSTNTINEGKEIVWEMIKENVTVIFKVRNID